MTNKALEIISTFSRNEIREFEKFLSSPYFNNNSKVTLYFRILSEYYPSFAQLKLSDRELFRMIYPAESFRSDRVRKLSSELYKQAQKFITQVRFEKNIITGKRYLLEELSERKLDNQFGLKIAGIKTEAADFSKQNYTALHEMFAVENTEISFHLERNRQVKTKDSVIRRGEYLVTYFLMMLFKSIDDMESNASVYNAEYEGTLLNEFYRNFDASKVIAFIKENNSAHSVPLLIYYSLFRAWQDFENDSLYFEAKDLVDKHLDVLHINDKESILVIMMNYCIKKFYYSQKAQFNFEKFHIYKLYLKHEIFMNSKNLRETVFMNILKLATMIHEFKWAKDFVDNYVHRFISEDADRVKHFSYAIIAFHTGDYETSLRESSRVTASIHEMGDKIGLKTYVVCSHYELGNYDAAYEELKNMKIFLKNKNISKYFRDPALNFTKGVTKLLAFRLSRRNRITPAELEKKIKDMGVMNFQGWIISKIHEPSV